ncbi:MAG: DUF1570 domain-containing protein [Planctomycetota bacterium]|nr:DUF1570 domain-containing protein [Planctomycetota bacterium]
MGVALGVVLVLARGVAADADRLGFERKLRGVEAQIRALDWERGKRELQKLLSEYAERDFVRSRRDDIAALMKKCVFRLRFPKPRPDKLVSGELFSCKLSTGKIRVRYTPRTMMGDFVRNRSAYIHESRFRGPHSIVLQGKMERLAVCSDEKRQYLILLEEDICGIVKMRGKAHEILQRAKRPAAAAPFVVSVREREITVATHGKVFLRAPKQADEWGFLVLFSNCFESVVIDGLMEPAWLQGRVDKEEQKQLASFERVYRHDQYLPKWLFAAERSADPRPAVDVQGWPSMSLEQHAVAAQVLLHFDKREFDTGERILLTKGDVLPPAVRSFLLGESYVARNRFEEAHTAYAEARKGAAGFLGPAARDAVVLERMHRYEEALEACQTVLAKAPTNAKLQVLRMALLLKLDRLGEARSAARQAERQGVASRDFQKLRRLIELAAQGPTWPRTYEHKSIKYHIVSDIDEATCERAAGLLEEAYQLFASTFEHPPAGARRYRVLLFSGEAGYKRHVRDLDMGVMQHTAGLYTPRLRQLLIWNLPKRKAMMQVIQHEGFHQYIHTLMYDPPRWFNEGLAVYVESARNARDLDRPHAAALKALEHSTVSLKDYFKLTPRQFYAQEKSGVHYAQAWALVHFLRHSTKENRELFQRMWDTCKRVRSPDEAMRQAFEGVDLDKLDEEFRRHIVLLRFKR